jgi:hypothetical protein
MNKLEKTLAEYHKYLMLRKLAEVEYACVPRSVRRVGVGLGFARPDIQR